MLVKALSSAVTKSDGLLFFEQSQIWNVLSELTSDVDNMLNKQWDPDNSPPEGPSRRTAGQPPAGSGPNINPGQTQADYSSLHNSLHIQS